VVAVHAHGRIVWSLSVSVWYFLLFNEGANGPCLSCAALRCAALPCAALYCAFRWLTRRPRLRIQLDIMGFTSGLMYFGYMFLASYAFSVGTGTIGFISSFFFVRAIYGSIKVD
jgi:hypothetical protein